MEEPDSWESLADPTDTAVLGTSSLPNPHAAPSPLNVHAEEFVPSFLRKPEAPGKTQAPVQFDHVEPMSCHSRLLTSVNWFCVGQPVEPPDLPPGFDGVTTAEETGAMTTLPSIETDEQRPYPGRSTRGHLFMRIESTVSEICYILSCVSLVSLFNKIHTCLTKAYASIKV